MTRPLVLALLLLPCVAGADPGYMMDPTLQGAGGKRPAFSFTAPSASAPASLTAATGQTLTCTRAGTATYQTSATALASASANTCRVDYRGLLVEESRTNIALQGEAIHVAPWSALSGSFSSASAAPDGTSSAYQLIADTSSANHRTEQGSIAWSAVTYTSSVYAKYAGYRYLRLRFFWGATDASGNFDVQNCAVATFSSGSFVSRSVLGAPSNWCRAIMVASGSAGTGNLGLTIQTADDSAAFVGDGASGQIYWGAQVEQGSFATSLIFTAATSVTRSADVIDVGAVTLPAIYALSATVNPEGLSGTETSLYLTDGTHTRALSVDATGHAVCAYGATADTTTTTLAAGVATKIACKYDGARVYACLAGTCTAGTVAASDGATAMTHMCVGSNGSANFANGFLSTLCMGKAGACKP